MAKPTLAFASCTIMITASQVKKARKLLGWTQKDCAEKAGVSLETLVHMEAGLKALPRTKEAIQSALEAAGIEFMSGAQVRLTERK
jgi:DNA-binding XRE family transcriptional regulator